MDRFVRTNRLHRMTVPIVSLVFVILILIQTVYTLHIFDDNVFNYVAYGNQLQEAYHYLDLSHNLTTIDEASYLGKFYRCYNLHRHKNGPTCMNELNAAYFAKTRIWKPDRLSDRVDASVRKRNPDCSYQVQYLGHQIDNKISDLQWQHYFFSIHQRDCRSETNIQGGSTFMITSFNDDNMGICRYIDHHNNKYTLTCSHRVVDKSSISSCMNLTILIDYEHYDGYSDGLPGLTSKTYKGYNELRYNMHDNQQYCINLSSSSSLMTTLSSSYQPNNLTISNKVRYFTGEWLSELASRKISNEDRNGYYAYPVKTMFSGFDHRHETNQLSLLAYGNLSHDSSIPFISRSVTSQQLSHIYSYFHPIMITSTPNQHQQDDMSSIIGKWKLSPTDSTMTYHFIGASHMRYIYDAIIEHTLSETELADLKAHHGDVTKYNMKNYHSNIDYASIISDDQSDFLRNLCSSFTLESNHTIIFQTGAWDITNAPIRRFLKDSNTGIKLLTMMKQILTRKNVCPQLRHFVWVTTVPHPICFNDDEPLCQENKGYRTNGAISSLIQYYLSELLSIQVRDGLLFSVVDSYSHTLPRLLFHPDSESTCLSHYHCRVKLYEDIPEKSKLVLAHTPSGLATVQLVLSALTR